MAVGYVTVSGAGGVSTSDKSQLDIDGLSGLTMITLVALDDYTPTSTNNWLFAKDEGSSQRSYAMLHKNSGKIQLPVSSDGSARLFPASEDVSLLVADGSHIWLKWYYETDGTNYSTTYEYSLAAVDADLSTVSWSAVGGDDSGTFGAIFNSTAPLVFGNRDDGTPSSGVAGKLYAAWLYDGTQATGTLVADPDFRSATPGADNVGNTWAMVGDATYTAPTSTNATCQMSWAELEVPTAPRHGQVSWAELETPTPPRAGAVSWAEMEVPLAPRKGVVSWAELEVPTAPRHAQVSWAEMEAPATDAKGQVSWAEMQVPDSPGGDTEYGGYRLVRRLRR